jgi:hypothetical protein
MVVSKLRKFIFLYVSKNRFVSLLAAQGKLITFNYVVDSFYL